MQTKKKYLASAVIGLGLASQGVSAEGFDVSEKLTLSGFIDMSYVTSKPDEGSTSSTFGLDQFEVDFLYDFGEGLSAQVDLEYQDNGSGEEVDIEQAYFSYAVSEGLSVKAGRFLSYSGWETEEPTGLFQYSGTGYAKYFYGGYQQGASIKYASSVIDVGASIVNDIGDLEGEARGVENPALELMFAVRPIEGWTAKAFYMTDKLEGTDETSDLFNFWTSVAFSGFTLAGELNISENAPAAVGTAGLGAEADGFLLMGNYAWDKFALTVRYHESQVETSGGVSAEELSAFTIAPSFTLSDNFLLVTEYRMDDDALLDTTYDTFAIEALITF